MAFSPAVNSSINILGVTPSRIFFNIHLPQCNPLSQAAAGSAIAIVVVSGTASVHPLTVPRGESQVMLPWKARVDPSIARSESNERVDLIIVARSFRQNAAPING